MNAFGKLKMQLSADYTIIKKLNTYSAKKKKYSYNITV